MPVFDGDVVDGSAIHTHPDGSILLGHKKRGYDTWTPAFPDQDLRNELLHLSLNLHGVNGIHSTACWGECPSRLGQYGVEWFFEGVNRRVFPPERHGRSFEGVLGPRYFRSYVGISGCNYYLYVVIKYYFGDTVDKIFVLYVFRKL